MKFSKWILGAALLFSAQIASVQGAGSCDSCDPCKTCSPCDLCDVDFCDMEFCGYADFLYWQVCRSDLDYESDDDRFLEPGYDAGWRIGAVAHYQCWDFGLRYTSFCTSDSRSGNHYDFDFRNFDVEVGYTCHLDCINGHLRPFAGAKFVWVDEELDIDDEEDKLDYRGYGLYLGLEGRYQLCEFCACDKEIPVAFVARASTGILHSKFDHRAKFHNDECLYVAAHELYAGLDFAFNDMCGCWNTYMQIGYEVQKFGEWRYNEDDGDDLSIASLGFGGLVVRFGACF